jgi:hypothetical protein
VTLRKRLERLEAERSNGACDGPSVVFLCDGATGEPLSALVMGGGSVAREPNETREAFEARAMAGAPAAIHLPANGRDALATGKAPRWAKCDLILDTLRRKHQNL